MEPGEPPAGLSVELRQYRADLVAHKILVALTNAGSEVYVKDLRFESESLQAAEPTRIEQSFGRIPRVDLPLDYAPRCDAAVIPEAKPVSVIATIRDGGGLRQVRFKVRHPEPLLVRILKDECGAHILRQAIDARLTALDPQGDRLYGTLVITRKGSGQPVTITEIAGNPHYGVESVEEKLPYRVPPGSGDLPLKVLISPTRCDPHSFAEAKFAHVFAVVARVGDGATYQLPFYSEGKIRQDITTFALKSCGLKP